MQHVALTLEGVAAFGGANPLTPPNTRAAALYTTIGAAAVSLRAHADDQVTGNAEFRSAVLSRREASQALLEQMRPINRIARALPRAEFPGVRALFRMPRSYGYAAVLSRANSFVEEVGPMKAVFVERGLAADFDEQLSEKIAEITAVTTNRTLARAEQVGGTAGIGTKASEGLAAVVELDSILTYLYRNNAALLAAWKSVRHVQVDPVRKKEQPTGSGGSGSGSPGDPGEPVTLALNGNGSAPAIRSAGEPMIAGIEPRSNGTNGGLIG